MSRANEAELAKSIAEQGSVGFFPYKNEGLQLKVHYNSVFLDEKGAMEILLNCLQNGRKVFGKQFGMDLIDYLTCSQHKEVK